jgi:hypothetical protein
VFYSPYTITVDEGRDLSMDGVKHRMRADEDERSTDIWGNTTAEEPFR